MRGNRVPTVVRLRLRIAAMEQRAEEARHHPSGPNPYWACRHCGIRDPQLSVTGRHFRGCPVQGLVGEIAHLRRLLLAAEVDQAGTMTATHQCAHCGGPVRDISKNNEGIWAHDNSTGWYAGKEMTCDAEVAEESALPQTRDTVP